MSIEILAPGLLTSVQDAGRHTARAFGVGVGGAADAFSYHVSNLLVRNPPDAAALEITLNGPMLRLHRAATIALCGATIDAHADGIPLPGWRPIALPAGCTLSLGACRCGARAYLAVDGGIDLPFVLGSRSTDLRGGFGGHEGRALRAGDRLQLGVAHEKAVEVLRISKWWIDADIDREFADLILVRVLSGSDETIPFGYMYGEEFVVDTASNRQGLRLRHDGLMDAGLERSRISEPVVPGTMQLPPDGQPIILLADAQTVGGYPRIGHVIDADLPSLAQRRAGQRLNFLPVDQPEARRANAEQRARLARIALAIASRRNENQLC